MEPTGLRQLPNFTDRLAHGEALEQRVNAELAERGWTVCQWGQGAWPEPIRRALTLTESDMRHVPDLVAARGSELVFIDCKNSMPGRDGDAHTISRRCLAASRKLAADWDFPVYYVFDSLGVMTPDEVMGWSRIRRLGSAGAYIRIPRHLPSPFDDTFGARSAMPFQRAA